MQKIIRPNLAKSNKEVFDALENKRNANSNWVSSGILYNNLKQLLKNTTKNHCTFCDGYPLGVTSKQTIEHYYPKSEFPEKTYEWENLFFCCDQCQSNANKTSFVVTLKPDEEDYDSLTIFVVRRLHLTLNPSPTRRGTWILSKKVNLGYVPQKLSNNQDYINKTFNFYFYFDPIEGEINVREDLNEDESKNANDFLKRYRIAEDPERREAMITEYKTLLSLFKNDSESNLLNKDIRPYRFLYDSVKKQSNSNLNQ